MDFRKSLMLSLAVLMLSACGGGGGGHDTPAEPDVVNPGLTGGPIVISHRGASGYLFEHTLAAYELAIQMGVDYIEPDLQFTKDGHLVAMHDDSLVENTDVERVFQGRDSYLVSDFTLEEIKKLRVDYSDAGTAKDSYPGFMPEDGSFEIPTFEEVIEFAKEQNAKFEEAGSDRRIGIYPEAKQADPDMEDGILAALKAYGMDKADSRVFIQSFSEETISSLREKQQKQGTKVPQVLLGAAVMEGGVAKMGVMGASLKALDLSEVKKIADGVGVVIGYPAYPVTSEFIEQAHAADLRVHGWTFDKIDAVAAQKEYREYLDMGMDAMFTNYPDLAVLARDEPKAENHQFTTDGPIVISHRGASGYLPEHTLAAYELAIQMGVDYIEPDLQTTSDGELVAMHDATLDQNTNVEEIFQPRYGHSNYPVSDFTLDEIRRLKVDYSDAGTAETSYPGYTPSDPSYNSFGIPTFDEVIEFAKAQSAKHGRLIGIYPEAKQGDEAMEDGILNTLAAHQIDTAVNPVFIQSFSAETVRRLHNKQQQRGTNYPLIQLGYGLMEDGVARVRLTSGGLDGASSADLSTLAAFSNGLGISISGSSVLNKEWIDQAHAAGFKVHGWTFNKANAIDAAEEYYKFLEMGIDGYFSNYPNLGVMARDQFVKQQ